MKQAAKISLSIFILLFFISGLSIGQESSKVTKNKTLSFEGESEKAELKLEIDSKTTFLKIEILCNLEAGQNKITILDPDGKKRGVFTVKTESDLTSGSKTTINENVSGSLSKHFKAPKKGVWKITFVPQKANGGAIIKLEQYYSVNDEITERDEFDPVEIEK